MMSVYELGSTAVLVSGDQNPMNTLMHQAMMLRES